MNRVLALVPAFFAGVAMVGIGAGLGISVRVFCVVSGVC